MLTAEEGEELEVVRAAGLAAEDEGGGMKLPGWHPPTLLWSFGEASPVSSVEIEK
jgi:hypothetical protein